MNRHNLYTVRGIVIRTGEIWEQEVQSTSLYNACKYSLFDGGQNFVYQYSSTLPRKKFNKDSPILNINNWRIVKKVEPYYIVLFFMDYIVDMPNYKMIATAGGHEVLKDARSKLSHDKDLSIDDLYMEIF